MRQNSRRDFLKMSAAALAASASFSALPQSIQKALAIPAHRRTGTLKDVEHVVILMQENRSFDHYFGTLGGVRGFNDRATLPIDGQASVFQQGNGSGGYIEPFRCDSTLTNSLSMSSLAHGWPDGHAAWNGGRWDGWIAAKSFRTMGHFTREDLPFHYALADAFTLCDQYFCSCMGPTNPNRVHLFSGMLDVGATGQGPLLDNNPPLGTLTWTTYVERLQKAGVSWRVYQGTDGTEPFKTASTPTVLGDLDYPNPYNAMRLFQNIAEAPAASPLAAVSAKRTYAQLIADVKADQLAQVSWLMPAAWCSEHPVYTPPDGATYIAAILDALTANPEVWAKTALFICYDENDGFFDHVVPPTPPANAQEGLSNVDIANEIFVSSAGYPTFPAGPVGLGARVPLFVVSPWSKGAWTSSEVFDHTSIIRFLEARFGVIEPNISAWRRAVCGDLTSTFDFSKPDRSPVSVPSTAGLVEIAAEHANDPGVEVPDPQVAPRQEGPARLLRATPYELSVDAKLDDASGAIRLHFANAGRTAVGFNVHSAVAPTSVRRYTVAARTELADQWALPAEQAEGPAYALTVVGPNGFVRGFSGTPGAAELEVGARYLSHSGDLELQLSNGGDRPCAIEIADNRYGKGTRRLIVPRKATVSTLFDLTDSFNWYDVTVTSSADASFARRFAGYVETGIDGITDPGFGAVPARAREEAALTE